MGRDHVWPEGHWGWPVKLPYKHSVRKGNLIFVGGQVAMDDQGNVHHPYDVAARGASRWRTSSASSLASEPPLDGVVKLNRH